MESLSSSPVGEVARTCQGMVSRVGGAVQRHTATAGVQLVAATSTASKLTEELIHAAPPAVVRRTSTLMSRDEIGHGGACKIKKRFKLEKLDSVAGRRGSSAGFSDKLQKVPNRTSVP